MHEDARKLIIDRFDAVWQAGSMASMPLERENHEFKRPENAVWGRLSLQFGRTEPHEIGNRGERTPFVLFLQIFIPPNGGTLAAYVAADILRPIKSQPQLSDDLQTVVHFRPPSVPAVADVAGFKAFNVTIMGYFAYDPAS